MQRESKEQRVRYSVDENNFNFETVADVFDFLIEQGEFSEGAVYYSITQTKADLTEYLKTDSMFEAAEARMFYESNASGEGVLDVSQQALDELQDQVTQWVRKHCKKEHWVMDEFTFEQHYITQQMVLDYERDGIF